MITDIEKGKYLAQIREWAGLKQSELAQRMSLSAPTLSRIEAGERPLTAEELDSLLKAIGTEEAQRLKGIFNRDWQKLKRPRLGHPDEELLWEAEGALLKLAGLSERGDLKNAFVQRLKEYEADVIKTSELLLDTAHQVALIGCIGVGKSTAICRITGLEVASATSHFPVPVMEAGGGGVTLCEVHLHQGPGYGLIVEPLRDEEIRRDVQDFADFLKSANSSKTIEKLDSLEGDSLGISRELVRVVRNMSGLTIKREKTPEGKFIRRDLAKELAAHVDDPKSLAVEILARMNLHKRDRRNIWYSDSIGKEPLPWLKEEFELINNGRHPEFSIPQRIEVIIPKAVLKSEKYSIRIIDTKGIDQTAQRADLENHFNESHTISILCSGFLQAPAPEAQQLLRRAIDGGAQNLEAKAGIVVLPRPGEALAIRDDQGFGAETSSMGYELKSEQVESSLKALNLPNLKTAFFNSREDDPEQLREFILNRIEDLREYYRARIKQIVVGASALVTNVEKEQVQEIQRVAARRLVTWVKSNSALPPIPTRLQDSLLAAVTVAHASSISASVRREGGWPNLDYSHQLGYGARRMAAASVIPKFEGFKAIAENLLQDTDLADAHNLVQQAQRVMESGIEDLLRKVQLLGVTAYTNGLKSDSSFWQLCEAEWGAGPGYRDRVSSHNVDWFSKAANSIYQNQVQKLIEKEWADLIARLSPLLEIE